jgi:hypothetical protein
LPTVADDAASVTDVPVTTGVDGFGGGAAATSIGLTGGGIVGGGGGGASEPFPAAVAGAVIDGRVAVSARGGELFCELVGVKSNELVDGCFARMPSGTQAIHEGSTSGR